MKQTLFQISDDLRALEEILVESGGDISDPATEAALEAFFAELGEARDQKVDNIAALIREWETRAKSRRDEAARMTELARVDENAAKRLKIRLAQFFEAHDLKRIDTPRFRVSLAGIGGKTPLVFADNFDASRLPTELQRVVIEPDKEGLRELLESGGGVIGVTLGERGKSLRIA
ncbi:MAG TPA: siphovirus Gp157 family protein [Abditibacterium sp.]|jgi:hypothetical protein